MRSAFFFSLFTLSVAAFGQASPLAAETAEDMRWFAQNVVPRMVKDSRKEFIRKEALAAVELWIPRFASHGRKSARFLQETLIGFPNKDGEPTQDMETTIRGLKNYLERPDKMDQLENCLTGKTEKGC